MLTKEYLRARLSEFLQDNGIGYDDESEELADSFVEILDEEGVFDSDDEE